VHQCQVGRPHRRSLPVASGPICRPLGISEDRAWTHRSLLRSRWLRNDLESVGSRASGFVEAQDPKPPLILPADFATKVRIGVLLDQLIPHGQEALERVRQTGGKVRVELLRCEPHCGSLIEERVVQIKEDQGYIAPRRFQTLARWSEAPCSMIDTFFGAETLRKGSA